MHHLGGKVPQGNTAERNFGDGVGVRCHLSPPRDVAYHFKHIHTRAITAQGKG